MDHRIDVAPHQADLGAEDAKLALLIGELDAQSEQPLLANHLALQNSAEHSVVDVSSTQDKSYAFSAEPLRVVEHGGKPCRAGTFAKRLFNLEQQRDSGFNPVFRHENDVVDVDMRSSGTP